MPKTGITKLVWRGRPRPR